MNPQDYNHNPYEQPQNPQPLTPEQIAQLQGFYGSQNPPSQTYEGQNIYQRAPQQGYYPPQGQVLGQQNYQNQPQNTPLPDVVPEKYRGSVVQASAITSQNPYTVDYLERIAPKQETPFWTKGKMALAGFLGVALILALGIMIFGSRGDDDKTATLRIYYNLEEAKLIAKKYQKKIKSSDLSADNAGISSSLSSDQEAIEKYMTDRKIPVPKAHEKKNSQFAQQIVKEYSTLDKKIEDAHLAGRMDENYSREFGYQLVLIKDLISKNAKSVGKKSREKLEPIIKNLDVAITKFDNFLKNSK